MPAISEGAGMSRCVYCEGENPKGRSRYCSDLHRTLFWFKIYEAEISIKGKRPSIPGAWNYVCTYVLKLANNKCSVCGRSIDEIHQQIRDELKGEPSWRIQGEIERSSLQVHHRVPLYKGGDSQFDNLIAVCRPCHLKLHQTIRSSDIPHDLHQRTLFEVGVDE